MQQIIISNLNILCESLKKHYFTQNKRSSYFSFNVVKIDSFRTIIIIEPFKIKSIYFSISPIWKRYLTIHSPQTKLIVMGFCNFQSRNYIDLLNLPKDFNAYVENALPVSEDWEIPIDGANMLDYLKRFFEGHGGDSLISRLTALKQTFNTAAYQLAQDEMSFQQIWQELLLPFGKPEWEAFFARWQNYYPYFEYLPFYPTVRNIDETFSEISEFFSCKNFTKHLFLKLKLDIKIDRTLKQLSEIDRLYIHQS